MSFWRETARIVTAEWHEMVSIISYRELLIALACSHVFLRFISVGVATELHSLFHILVILYRCLRVLEHHTSLSAAHLHFFFNFGVVVHRFALFFIFLGYCPYCVNSAEEVGFLLLVLTNLWASHWV